MLKGKVLLFCLSFVAIVASFVCSEHATKNMPYIMSVEIGVLLVITGMVAFFLGYHCAIGRPAKFKNIKDGDYYAIFDLEKRVVEMREVDSSHLDESLLISELPPELMRSIDDGLAKGLTYKIFSKRTVITKEKKTVIDVK